MERRLAAILAADVVGYSRLIREDEAGTLAALKAHREQLIEPKVAERKGRIVKLMGDGILVEFPSAVEAVRCAVEIQHMIGDRNADVSEGKRITYRIGINIGDIVVEDNDIYGDGVNVAARLEGLSEPNGICVARNVFDQVKDKLDLTIEHLGEREFKNIAEPVTVYRVVLDDKAAALVTPVVQEAAKPVYRRWVVATTAAVVLVAAVGGTLWWQPWAPDVAPVSIEKMAFPLPDKPSIAVLPFDNMSDDSGQDYFADGITEDLITDLSKIAGLFVIARNSTFNYKGKTIEVRQVAEELGVRYILEGSVRRVGDQVRINARLVDAMSGGHLWAERYDGVWEDVFGLQDEVIGKIVRSLSVRFTAVEQEELRVRHEKVNLEAYEYLLRGRELLSRIEAQDTREAQAMFEKAISIDPDYARAYTNLGLFYWHEWQTWGRDRDVNLARALEHGKQAAKLDPGSAEARLLMALVFQSRKEHDKAEIEADKALTLDPVRAEALGSLGGYLRRAGRPREAIEALEKAIRLDPFHPPTYLSWLGHANFMIGQYDRAIEVLREGVKREPNYIAHHLYLAASYATTGRKSEAEQSVTEVLRLNPRFTISAYEAYLPVRRRVDLERDLAAFRKAGLPEK